ncbi:MAG: glycosyltransferase, partial [Chloroflexi bacterium]|nr:glycosyltransferase [Chloroflexota bacterium]
KGQAEAINKGFTRASGDVIAWLNSDDTYLPGAVRSAVQALEGDKDLAFVYGNMFAMDAHSRTTNHLKYRQYSLEDLLCFQIIGQPAVFMRRSAFEKAGGLNPAFHFMLDHHLWIRMAQFGRMLHISRTLASARYHPAAKNRAQPAEFGQEAFRILEWAQGETSLAGVFERVSRRARASANRVNARYRLDAGEPVHALRFWLNALLIHPPTALARMNILASALLNLAGFGTIREYVLRRRQAKYRGDDSALV